MHTTVIDTHAVLQNIGDPHWIIVDCRYDLSDPGAGYRGYLDGHIPGAVYADLKYDLSGPPITDHGRHPLPTPERLNDLFSTLGIDHERQVVAYDASFGAVAARMWWLLQYMGHAAVCVLDGGWQQWLKSGYQVEREERRNPRLLFAGRPQTDRVATLADIATAPLLLDAREPARYRGEQEPFDPVAGHIPGAMNHYWKNNLDAEGNFLPPGQIRRILFDLYAGVPPETVVCYCGSGVTACHNILAAAHGGLPSPRLYSGSWSEWCSDRRRPAALGPA
jgi:thiosulfate/3-mercaptopyruvate sulfurtransferase